MPSARTHTIVLLHAFSLDARMWKPQLPALREHYQVITPDVRGFAGIDDAADAVASQIDRPVVLGGLSRGGYISLAFARRHPDKLRGLLLMDTTAAPDSDEARRGRYEMADRLTREGIGFLPEVMMPRLLCETSRRTRPELVAQVTEVILAQDPADTAAAARGMAERQDSRPFLGGIRVPVRAIAGAEDALRNATEEIAHGIPGADFIEIPQAGHLPTQEQPALVTRAIREFLDRLPR